ncbi:hypothetical protein ACSMXM_00535 [Pacificimonas sp. ICDLI1SI03]
MSRFGTIGLGVLTVGATMGLYLSSYHVAEKREDIAKLQQQIDEDAELVAKLERELGTLANLDRLEAINASVWRYHAPKPGQIVGGPVQFAAVMAGEAAPEMQLAVIRDGEDSAVTDKPVVRSIALADRKPEVPQPLTDSKPASAPARAKAKTPANVVLASSDPADLPPLSTRAPSASTASTAAPASADLFSDGFITEVETAATLERAGFRKVVLR